jgi:hypothetical protein
MRGSIDYSLCVLILRGVHRLKSMLPEPRIRITRIARTEVNP